MKILISNIVLLLVLAACVLPAHAQGTWQGYQKTAFEVEGRAAWIVKPHMAAPGRPWVWRARFWGHEPQVDLELLRRGVHLAYCDVADLFGSPRAVAIWEAFYERVIAEHQLAPRVGLEGMSRGGLIIYNWAAAHPDKVACIYADAPVCVISSWPGGQGVGPGNPRAWANCLKAWGLTEDAVADFRNNPIDLLEPLAATDIPLLHVVGMADEVVPVAENTDILLERYQALGGRIDIIRKPEGKHHPHALEDPTPIVDFFMRHIMPPKVVQLRGTLNNLRAVLTSERQVHVAFLGGSITEMRGFRPMVINDLRRSYPSIDFAFTNAGISSTCSTTGAFRLQHDVLDEGPVDLLLVEFAVNDDQDAFHTFDNAVRGMEGIIRHTRHHNPHADIVMVYFVNPRMLKQLKNGDEPLSIAAHRAVAEHYNVSTLNVAAEVARRIEAEELSWSEYGGVHPGPTGNRICADMVLQLFEEAWSGPEASTGMISHPTPEALQPDNYQHGVLISPDEAEADEHWSFGIPDWAQLEGNKRSRFAATPLLHTEQAGATLHLNFDGTAIGAYVLAGPDAGVVEVRIDDGPWREVNLFHRQHSTYLHYPRTVMFAQDLEPGAHRLVLRTKATRTTGKNAARIMYFAVNAMPQS